MLTFNIGDKVKLKDYTDYGDYKFHENQVAIIISKVNYDTSDFDYNLRWKDDRTSLAAISNMFLYNTEWNEAENTLTETKDSKLFVPDMESEYRERREGYDPF